MTLAPLFCFLALTILLSTGPARAGGPVAQLQGEALLESLRAGSFVLLFRHAATDLSQRDADRSNLENCATQRNLSAHRREQAIAIGQA